MTNTFAAGLLAGGIQSVIAAPLDALQVRFDAREGHYENKTMWQYGRGKLHDIGLRGVFAGWGISFAKDSLGSGLFFATFEYVKAQGYYKFVRYYYGSLEPWVVKSLALRRNTLSEDARNPLTIRPHYALEPAFLTLAGMAATVTQQSVVYPLNRVQNVHYGRLEGLDEQAKKYEGVCDTWCHASSLLQRVSGDLEAMQARE